MRLDENSKVVIFGGTGFLGHYVIRRLLKLNCKIDVVSRKSELPKELKVGSEIGRIALIKMPSCDNQWEDLLAGCTHVINLIGILSEKKRGDFRKIHIDLARKIAIFSKKNNVHKLIHVSALISKIWSSEYGLSKISGEAAVLEEFPDATILRPSLMFGSDNDLFSVLINTVCYSPILPLIAGGKIRFQPIYIDNVAEAIIEVCNASAFKFRGEILELGGEKLYSVKQLFEMISLVFKKKRMSVSISTSVAIFFAHILELLPFRLLNPAQVKFLSSDSIVCGDNAIIREFGIKPKSILDFLYGRTR